MDVLFKPRFAAAAQVLKLEVTSPGLPELFQVAAIQRTSATPQQKKTPPKNRKNRA